MIFKTRLLELLQERRLSQAELARLTNIPTSLISNYATGKTSPALENAIAISDALHVSLDELVGRDTKVLLNYEEQELIRKFRLLDEYEKREISGHLDYVVSKKKLQKDASNVAG